jgi:hypothetical protein
MLMLVLAIACLAGSVYMIAEVVSLPASERMLSFRRAAAYGGRSLMRRDGRTVGSLKDRALRPAMERSAHWVMRINPKMTIDDVNLRLLSTGVGRSVSPMTFVAAKGFGAIGGLVLGFIFGSSYRGSAWASPRRRARRHRVHRPGLRPQLEDPEPARRSAARLAGRARPARRERRGRTGFDAAVAS